MIIEHICNVKLVELKRYTGESPISTIPGRVKKKHVDMALEMWFGGEHAGNADGWTR